MDYCAPHAFEVARRFRERGKTVIAGGRYATSFPERVLPHVDSVVVGEAEGVWPGVVFDLLEGRLQRLYRAPVAPPLVNIPVPRYDLAESSFAVPVVTEATRGCPFRCSYCQLNINTTAHRCRPIADVIRDLSAVDDLPWKKRRLAMLYDNNLGGNMDYAKELLAEIAGLDLWGLGVQFSLNCLRDRGFVDALERARVRMAFLGMESLQEESLRSVGKRQNRVHEYREQFADLRSRGILVFAGTMVALDEDTPEYYRSLPEKIEKVDPAAIFISMSIPIPGTPFHREVVSAGRLRTTDLRRYDGDHLVLDPVHVSDDDVYDVTLALNRTFYSTKNIFRRWTRLLGTYLRHRRWLFRLGPALLLSYILVSLSLFQRKHARDRVYPLIEARARRASSGGPPPCGHPGRGGVPMSRIGSLTVLLGLIVIILVPGCERDPQLAKEGFNVTAPEVASILTSPPGVVTVPLGDGDLTFWPYTGNGFDGEPVDPINLILVGADPVQIRAALLALDSDRSSTPFPPVFPFDARWEEAIGDVQTAYAEQPGWTGSVIQLQLGGYDPVRFHLRLFGAGETTDGRAITLGAAHFELLIPRTTEHQVLSWELPQQLVMMEFIRAGLLAAPPAPSEVITAAPFYREIPEMIYNGLPGDLVALIGGPATPVTGPMDLPNDGRATILTLGDLGPVPAGTLRQILSVDFDQIIPRPFCSGGPEDWLLVQGTVDFHRTGHVSRGGRYRYSSRFSGRLVITPMDITQNPPQPIGEPETAIVKGTQSGFEQDDRFRVHLQDHRLSRGVEGTERMHTVLRVNSRGRNQHWVRTRCITD